MINTFRLSTLIFILSVFSASTHSYADEWKKSYLLKCAAKNVLSLGDDGFLKEYKNDFWHNYFQFTVDLQTGIFRLKDDEKGEKWITLQTGDAENDTVISNKDDGKSFDYFIRIRDWKSRDKKPITFMFVDYGRVISGLCESIH